MKGQKKKILAGLALMLLLAVAFWYGGNMPDSHGWSAGNSVPQQSQSVEPAVEEESAETAEPQQQTDPQHQEDPGALSEAPAEQQPAAQAKPQTAQPNQTAQAPAAADTEPSSAPAEPTCTISISCSALLEHLDWCDPAKVDLIPQDGWILQPVTVTFTEGESVFDVLQRTCREKKIHMEYTDTPVYDSAYIEGIHNLYEFDAGEQSGWMYAVNGSFPNYGCSQYKLQDGDVIRWVYTCDLGEDVRG